MSSIVTKKIDQVVTGGVTQPLALGKNGEIGIDTNGNATVGVTLDVNDDSKKIANTEFVKNVMATLGLGGGDAVYGLIYNRTSDIYKRFGTGTSEDTQWLSTTATRLNDSVNSDFVTSYFNQTKTVQGNMKRVVVDNTGAYVKDYNASSYSHSDQTGLTASQAVMVQIPKFYYVMVDFVDSGISYTVMAQSLNSFTLDLTTLGFSSPSSISGQNVTGYKSYDVIVGSSVTAVVHPAFLHNDGSTKSVLYMGAFKSYSFGSGYKSTCTTTGTSTPVKATCSQTIATYRSNHQTFGSKFQTQNWFHREALVLTAIIERGTFLTEVNGTSSNNKWEGYSWNTSASSDDQNMGQTLVLGNMTGVIKDGSNRTIANSYRGVEDYHSHLWEFVDGINIINGLVYVAKPGATYVSDTTASPYFSTGRTTLTSGGGVYTTGLFSGTFIPSAASGGSSTTKYTDGGWYATGNRILVCGGYLNYPGLSGTVCWNSNTVSSYAYWDIGSRFSVLA